MVRDWRTDETSFMRLGAICAVVGTLLTMTAGANFNNLTNEGTTETIVRTLALKPVWYWPAVHLFFIFGATLWAFAFVALARSFPPGIASVLGWFAVVAMIVGVVVHIVDSSISGYGLASLSQAWATASITEQPKVLQQADTLLLIMHGTWVNVLNFYSGIPFILAGTAVAFSRRYPSWLGWIAVLGGIGSLIMGILMFLRNPVIPQRVYIGFAILVSLWLLTIGLFMWIHGKPTQ
jgi:uncharacterized membrane protein